MLQRILDKVLAFDSVVAPKEADLSIPEVDAFAHDALHDLSWIEHMDFDADFWVSLPGHPLLAGDLGA